MEYLKLALLWIGWCFVHSYLIAPSVTVFLKKHLKNSYNYFRLFYNIVAIISFIWIWLYQLSLQAGYVYDENILFSWEGYFRVLQVIIFSISIILFIWGGKNYDLRRFIGIRQISQNNSEQGLSKSGGLNITGVLKYTRHPWYLGGILFIWTDYNNLVYSKLIMNIILTLYLIVGTYLEERKLLVEFGDEYRAYQKKVSMLFPFKF